MVRIVWTEISTKDLNRTFNYIAENSLRYAAITANKIHQRVRPLEDNPLLGRVVPEFKDKSIRELLEGNYRIIYRIKSNIQVDVLRVYHSSRLLKQKDIWNE